MLTGVSLAVPGQRGFSQDLAAGARSRADGQAAPALLAQPLPRALARDDGAWPGGDTLLSRSIRNTLGPIPMANGNEAIIREFIAERIDKTRTSTGSVDLPCVGVFELEGGKIKAWRDYSDMATYTNAVSP
ncbi:MAG: limonene-1,2-epoxide hydrolase family protein [Gammaproteobacteria bacterium]